MAEKGRISGNWVMLRYWRCVPVSGTDQRQSDRLGRNTGTYGIITPTQLEGRWLVHRLFKIRDGLDIKQDVCFPLTFILKDKLLRERAVDRDSFAPPPFLPSSAWQQEEQKSVKQRFVASSVQDGLCAKPTKQLGPLQRGGKMRVVSRLEIMRRSAAPCQRRLKTTSSSKFLDYFVIMHSAFSSKRLLIPGREIHTLTVSHNVSA